MVQLLLVEGVFLEQLWECLVVILHEASVFFWGDLYIVNPDSAALNILRPCWNELFLPFEKKERDAIYRQGELLGGCIVAEIHFIGRIVSIQSRQPAIHRADVLAWHYRLLLLHFEDGLLSL